MNFDRKKSHLEHIIFFVFLFILITISISSSQNGISVRPVGHFGGYASCAAVSEDYAFLCQGTMLSVLDLTGDELNKVASYELPDEPIESCYFNNNLYLFDRNQDSSFIRIIDVHDPLNPMISASLCVQSPAQWSQAKIFADSHFVYLSLEDSLNIIDIRMPEQPSKISTIQTSANASFAQNGYLYVGTNEQFEIYNITNPSNPTWVGGCDLPRATDVFVFDNIACAAISQYPNYGMQIIDVTDPENPTKIGFFETKVEENSETYYKSPKYISVNDGIAYIACDGSVELFVVELSPYQNPGQVGYLKFDQGEFPNVESFQVNYPYAYAATGGSSVGFIAINIMDPAQPEIELRYEEPWDPQAMCSKGDTLYLASFERLWIYDYSDTLNPVLLGSDTAWTHLSRIIVEENYLYGLKNDQFGGQHSKMHIIDVTDPTNIFEVGNYSSPHPKLNELGIHGNFAYLLAQNGTQSILEVVNISNPSDPQQETGEFVFEGQGNDLVILQDSLLALIPYQKDETDKGFFVVDIADSSNLVQLNSVATQGAPITIDAVDTLAIVGSNTETDWYMEMFDLTDPSDISSAGSTSGAGLIWDVILQDSIVVASIPNGSLHYYSVKARENLFQFLLLKICHSPSSTFALLMKLSNHWNLFSIDGCFNKDNKKVSGSWGLFIQRVLLEKIDKLAFINIFPSDTTVSKGDSVKFKAKGYDDEGNETKTEGKWSATGGEMDTTGNYRATEEGDHTVSYEDTTQNVSASAYIHVTSTDVAENKAKVHNFSLSQNYPNPFNSKTLIRFSVKKKCHVLLELYNIQGRRVLTLTDREYAAGWHQLLFESFNLPSGIYFYKIRMGDFQSVKKMILLE